MGEPDVFELHLEGAGVYFGGQTVNGQVILQTDYELDNVKSLKVKIKGEGEVEWEETVSWNSNPSKKFYEILHFMIINYQDG